MVKKFHMLDTLISVPFLEENSFDLPVLVVPNTKSNSDIPVIIGTNFIRLCKLKSTNENVPEEWDIAFQSLTSKSIGTVKATQLI